MDVALLISPLAQATRRIVIEEPPISAETMWWIGATLFALWMFAVGGSVGSFLNVVVYRLPAGLNLGSPGSRCPRCLSPIRLRHNIPILGWLLLRGRCADCRLPISSRYPLVELSVAMLFMVVGCVEMLGNGDNLPIPPANSWRIPLTTLDPWPLSVALLMHVTLLTTLIAATLIDYDGHRIPRRLFLPLIFFAVVAAPIWPAVHPVPAFDLKNLAQHISPSTRWILGLIDVVAGTLGGLIAGGLIWLATASRPNFVTRYLAVVTLMWISIGLALGWQFIPLLLCFWSISLLVNGQTTVGHLRWIPPAAPLFALVLVALLSWRWWQPYFRTVEPHTITSWQMMLALIAVSIVTLVFAAQKWPTDILWKPPPQHGVEDAPASSPAEDSPLPSQIDEPS